MQVLRQSDVQGVLSLNAVRGCHVHESGPSAVPQPNARQCQVVFEEEQVVGVRHDANVVAARQRSYVLKRFLRKEKKGQHEVGRKELSLKRL